MKQSSDQVIEAFATLEGNHHFKVVMEWIAESAQDQTERLQMERDDIEMRRLQGAVTELNAISDLAENARSIIAQRRQSQQR